ncbi:hypothetical protein GA0061077_0224 [Bifidobacterium commune]|uniref:Uncharacterized protein n=1 Tax=Bifidobacterium commune TaxID=1505727 RepID=A0A1C4H0E4_9BIFI|nr:hypothetical protein GA0061077_0224 [Bifidobacterium commune]
MILAPALRIWNLKFIAQHIPYDTRLNTISQRFDHRHPTKRGQYLVLGHRTAVRPAQHLFQQLPKFAFLHAASLPAKRNNG